MAVPELRIRLLGEFDLRAGQTPVPPLESARARSLLSYLLLHRQAAQSRQRLSFLLWPDSTESQARTNLRHLLHNLRRSLPESDRYLTITAQSLQWREDAPYWLDVAAFQDALARAQGNDDGSIAALRQAVDLYTGDLLPGCYDEWLEPERDRLRRTYLSALERLTTLLEARGDHSLAITCAELLLRADPLQESTYRQLMRLHDARGERARALRVYHACVSVLERELSVEPAPATQAAYQALLPGQPDRTNAKAQDAGPVSSAVPTGSEPVLQEHALPGPPLIGRAAEWQQLQELWRTCEDGHAHLLLLTGEAGIGKTRLLEELRSWCGHRGVATAEARSYRAEGSLAFGAITQWLRSATLAARLPRLEHIHLSELSRLLPELSTRVPGLAVPSRMPEAEQRHRLFAALAHTIRSVAGPLLLLADDLQWCDAESLQFLHYLLRAEPRGPVLIAAAARREELEDRRALPELVSALHARECVTEIELPRLGAAETAELAARLTAGALSEAEAQVLFRETEGNPLFVVETMRAGWRHDDTAPRSLSPRVQASILSRLGRLSPAARDLVGLAAAVGREFTTAVIARASDTDEPTLIRALDELWRARMVREQSHDAYDFSHDKIREVAYQTLSPAMRRQHHLRIAAALKTLHAHAAGQVSGQVAAHYDRAGIVDQAIRWYEAAADSALRLHANAEALRLLARAQELLPALPDGPERQAHELAVINALLAPLSVVEGWASPHLERAHSEGLQLSRRLGVEPAPQLLRSLTIHSFSQDDFLAAHEYGQQLSARARHDRDDLLTVESEYVQGIAAF